MILFINLSILWANSALKLSYALAEMVGVEPTELEAYKVANECLTSKKATDRLAIRQNLEPEELVWLDALMNPPTEEEIYESDQHMAKRLGEDHP